MSTTEYSKYFWYRESCSSWCCSAALESVCVSWARKWDLCREWEREIILRSLCMYLKFYCNLWKVRRARKPRTHFWMRRMLCNLFYLNYSFSIAFYLRISISLFFLASALSLTLFISTPFFNSFYYKLYLCTKSSKVNIFFSYPPIVFFLPISCFSRMYSCFITSKGFTGCCCWST